MTLQIVKPDVAAPPLNALLYGGVGVGKTTAACSAPGPVLVVEAEPGNPLTFARRLFGDDKIREVAFNSATVLDDVALHLREGKGGEQTVVLDSLSEKHTVILEELTGGGKATLPNYDDTQTKIRRFCRYLVDLPVNVVFVAHELSVKDEHEGHFERLPHTGTSNPALGVKLMAMVDVVAYCGRKEPEKQGDPVRYVGQLFNGGGRRGKDRNAVLGDSRDLDLTEWVAAIADTHTQAAAKAAKDKPKTTSKRRAA